MTTGTDWWARVLAGRPDAIAAGDGASAVDRETYAVLAGRSDPRIVADVASATAIEDSIGRMASRSLPSPAKYLVPLAGKAASRWGQTWSVAPLGGEPTLRQHLGDVLGREVRLSIAVGPPRPNRKPVVRCFDGDKLVAIAKLGTESHTAELVKNEVRWLRDFEAGPLQTAYTASLIHHGSYADSELMVMSAFELETEVPPTISDMPSQVLGELRERTGTTQGIGYSGFWDGLETRLSDVADSVVRTAVASVVDHPDAGEVAVSFWHGDWSPWNVGRSVGGGWCVWDWERASTSAPIGFDELHLHHQYGDGLEAGRRWLVEAGRSPGEAQLLTKLYLLELVARHHEAGATSTDRHRVVLDLLDR